MNGSSLAVVGLAVLTSGAGSLGCARRSTGPVPVVSPRLSGDGSRLARTAVDGKGGLELWQHTPIGRIPLAELDGTVVAVALDGQGQRLAAVVRPSGARRRCRLERWVLSEGRHQARTVKACDGVTLSADGSHVAVFGAERLEIYEMEHLRPRLRQRFEPTLTAVAFGPDAREVVVASSTLAEGGGDRLWRVDLATGQTDGPFEGHQVIVQALAVRPEGQWVSAGIERQGRPTAHRWIAGRPEALPGVKPDAPFTSVAISPDGSTIAAVGTLGCDSASMLWTLSADGEVEAVVPNEQALVRPRYPVAVALSPQGPRIVVGSEWVTLAADGTVQDVRFEDPHVGGISLCSSPVAWPR
ncbi:MAG: hypothetical protein AAF799_24975 [Myxococcota bacterium]